jgi:hypothetical protein
MQHCAFRARENFYVAPWVAIIRRPSMKLLISALALAVTAVSPAMAATSQHVNRHTTIESSDAAAAYAAQRDPDTVVENGQVLGRDPDPNIRFQLMRDVPWVSP